MNCKALFIVALIVNSSLALSSEEELLLEIGNDFVAKHFATCITILTAGENAVDSGEDR